MAAFTMSLFSKYVTMLKSKNNNKTKIDKYLKT